jgi:hypothetical protein
MPAQVAAPTSLPPASATSFFEDETDAEREAKRDTVVTLPQPAPKPGNDDGEATAVIEKEALQRALRPTVHADLRGVEGVPEAAPGCHFSRSLETPRTSQLPEQKASK